MTTIYKNLEFKTKLEATWAAFFDLVEWQWAINPAPIDDWKPDFLVTFPCGHSECSGSHTILISVLAISDVKEVRGHPALAHEWSVENSTGKKVADAGAIFGLDPSVTFWVMIHGSGGGEERVEEWIGNRDSMAIWKKAQSQL